MKEGSNGEIQELKESDRFSDPLLYQLLQVQEFGQFCIDPKTSDLGGKSFSPATKTVISSLHHNMNPQSPVRPEPDHPARFAFPSSSHRKVAIAVDLSDESAYAVRWAVQNYLRPGDTVILLHVRPTSVLCGADWGSVDLNLTEDDNTTTSEEESRRRMEDEFDNFTSSKASDLAQPLVEAQFPFKIHIVKDHDMKERLCLEVERLGLSAVIMGSRGFGASKRVSKGRLGSVSDYCVHHCVCPVVVVRYPEENNGGGVQGRDSVGVGEKVELHTVPEEEQEQEHENEEYNDSSDEQKGLVFNLSW